MSEVALSVLIATRDRAKLLADTLNCLKDQVISCGTAWEIIVVDNGSSDDTPEVVGKCSDGLRLIYLKESKPGKSRALNRALDIAQGEILVFTDDDVIPSPLWLSELYRASQNWNGYNIFCGPIIPSYPRHLPEWFDTKHPYTCPAFGWFDPIAPQGLLPRPLFPFGANFAVRSKIMSGVKFCEKHGPHDNEPTGEDAELLMRLARKGERFIYVPSASIKHIVDRHKIDFKWFNQRAFRHGRQRARLHMDRSSMRLWNVPWYLWIQLLKAWVGYAASILRGKPSRFEKGWYLNRLRGIRFEYCLMAKEGFVVRTDK